MTTTDMLSAATPATTRRWPRYLLIASLALNLLFIGTIAGSMARGWYNGGAGQARGGPGQMMGFIASLPQERRAELFKKAREMRPQIRALRQDLREMTKLRADIIGAAVFDKARYLEVQTRQMDAEAKLRTLTRDMFAETAPHMTPDERRAFLRWRGGRPGGDDSDADAPPLKK